MLAKTNLILDLAIFGAYLVVASPTLTGVSIHEWVSIAFTATIVTHLLFHWRWLVKITTQFFKNILHPSRLNYVVDAIFFVAMTGTIFSGLLISKDFLPTLGIQIGEVSRGWRSIHSLSADASLILLGVHTALHWKWVVSTIGRYIVSPVRRVFKPQAAQVLVASPVLNHEEE